MFVVLEVQGELESALCVDFFHSDFSAVLDGRTVNSSAAGYRTDTADMDCAVISRTTAGYKGCQRHHGRECSGKDFLDAHHSESLLC